MIDIHDVKTLATILLIGRLVAVVLMSRVIWKQVGYIKQNDPPEIQHTRYVMLGFAIAVLLNNFIPVLVDILGAFDPRLKSDQATVKTIGVVYTMSNMVMSNIIALFFTYLYRKDKNNELQFEIRRRDQK